MRHILLALLTSVGLAASAQTAAAQPSDVLTAGGLPVPAAQISSTKPSIVTHCQNASVFGRVISPTAVQMQGFTCLLNRDSDNSSSHALKEIQFGACPLSSTSSAHQPDCKYDVALNVQLADPHDASKMQADKLVKLGGDFMVSIRGETGYVSVQNAKVLFVDFNWQEPNIACSAVKSPGRNSCVQDIDCYASKELGRKVCVPNDLTANLSATGPAVDAAARAALIGSAENEITTDPNTITCHLFPKTVASLAIRRYVSGSPAPPLLCAYNSHWTAPIAPGWGGAPDTSTHQSGPY